MRLKHFRPLLIVFIAFLMVGSLKACYSKLNHVNLPEDGKPALLFSTETGHDVQKSYIAAIKEAKKSILILSYTITDRHVIRALRQKSEEGVEVTLICHQDISYDIENRVGPKVKLLKRFGKGLMHLKIMVIDDEKSYIGSANLTHASLKMYGNLVTAFNSKALGLFLTEKAGSIGHYQNSASFKNQNFIIGNQLVEVWFLPDDPYASLRIKELIRGAKENIRIAMFTWTREDFAKEIIRATLRGVHVEVALDRSSSKGSSLSIFDLLKKSNILLMVNRGDELLHYKFLYIDKKIVVNGSANWTKNAFNTNDDCFIILHDLNETQVQEMENVWQAIERNTLTG